MKVIEIFESIQGESSYAGRSCLFIRLAGCNLKCKICDTKESWDIKNAKEYSVEKLSKIIEKSKCEILEFTGGDPLVSRREIDLLLDYSYKWNMNKILIESNGTLNVDPIHKHNVIFILDVKPPEVLNGKFYLENLYLCQRNLELKFLVGSNTHIDFIFKFLKENKEIISSNIIINISPIFTGKQLSYNYDWNKLLVKLRNKFPEFIFRLNLQIHKLIGVK